MKPTILFVMGVTGSGKTTLLTTSGVLNDPRFTYVQSLTTRDLRDGEVNGEKYRHISDEEFENNIATGKMLEYATVHQTAYYGTTIQGILEPGTQGKIAIKEIETQGLIRIINEGKIDGQFVSIFLDIPEEVLKQRLTERGTTDPDEVAKRIQSSYQERQDAKQYCTHTIDASGTKEEVVKEFWKKVNESFGIKNNI